MSLFDKSIKRALNISLALIAGAIFAACLNIPDNPDLSEKVQGVEVLVSQGGKTLSSPLKINSNDSAELTVQVTPTSTQFDLRCYWINEDEILDSGFTYTVYTAYMESAIIREKFIPQKILVVDNEGNRIEKEFSVIVNAPPILLDSATPLDGATIYATPNTPILFSWNAIDRDETGSLYSTLIIDGVIYKVGDLQSIQQSGLGTGIHTYQVLVSDSYGDSDMLPLHTFTVIDTTGGL